MCLPLSPKAALDITLHPSSSTSILGSTGPILLAVPLESRSLGSYYYRIYICLYKKNLARSGLILNCGYRVDFYYRFLCSFKVIQLFLHHFGQYIFEKEKKSYQNKWQEHLRKYASEAVPAHPSSLLHPLELRTALVALPIGSVVPTLPLQRPPVGRLHAFL